VLKKKMTDTGPNPTRGNGSAVGEGKEQSGEGAKGDELGCKRQAEKGGRRKNTGGDPGLEKAASWKKIKGEDQEAR